MSYSGHDDTDMTEEEFDRRMATGVQVHVAPTSTEVLTLGFEPTETLGAATFSADGLFRYRLSRTWSDTPPMTWIMLNPSTADAEQDDPTIRRCQGFARREGWGGIVVVNLFALRCTRPVHLFDRSIVDDPNGEENVDHVGRALVSAREKSAPVVVAWGAIGPDACYRSHAYFRWFRGNTGFGPLCLGKTKDGSPCHPLYRPANTTLEVWP